MNDLVRNSTEALSGICRSYGVARLEVFGSAADGTFDSGRSDIDFLVEFEPGTDLGPWMARYFDLKGELETLLGRPVDLVMATAPSNPYLVAEIDRSRELVYASEGAEVA